MNERIRELAIDCATQLDWDLPSDPTNYTFSSTGLEKFAELIVRECIDRINRVGILEDVEFQSDMIAQNVLEHFGVEGSFRNEILCEQNLRTPV